MAYGLRVWDRLGRLGTDTEDVLGLCLFAGVIPYTAFPLTTHTITDVDDRPRLVMYRAEFNGMWFIPATLDLTYDAGARTLTIRNSISSQPAGTFFMALQW